MNRSAESVLRFVNITAAGLLAGSLGFGGNALTPGSDEEREAEAKGGTQPQKYFNAIGPIALASSVTLAVGASRAQAGKRFLDAISAIGLAGVLATTTLVTVPLVKRMEVTAPVDYPEPAATTLIKNFGRAHTVRTALGISAFICAAASSALHSAK